jgi:pimeloyl-ACP methyl ester carboxylesterase
MDEISFTLPRSGISLHGQRNSAGAGEPVICLHGWLDNSASFEPLARALGEENLMAIDLPGHGLSDPIPSATASFLDYVACVAELVHEQRWPRYHLIGHSMGAAIAALAAGTFPEAVKSLVLIEPVLPFPDASSSAPHELARYLSSSFIPRESARYRDRRAAAKARTRLADILLDSAETLATRDLRPDAAGYALRTDPRLSYPFVHVLSQERVTQFLARIESPVLLITAERPYFDHPRQAAVLAALSGAQRITVPGGHHLHMDNAPAVAEQIRAFRRGWREGLFPNAPPPAPVTSLPAGPERATSAP